MGLPKAFRQFAARGQQLVVGAFRLGTTSDTSLGETLGPHSTNSLATLGLKPGPKTSTLVGVERIVGGSGLLVRHHDFSGALH